MNSSARLSNKQVLAFEATFDTLVESMRGNAIVAMLNGPLHVKDTVPLEILLSHGA